jgi:hypothetical protein
MDSRPVYRAFAVPLNLAAEGVETRGAQVYGYIGRQLKRCRELVHAQCEELGPRYGEFRVRNLASSLLIPSLGLQQTHQWHLSLAARSAH